MLSLRLYCPHIIYWTLCLSLHAVRVQGFSLVVDNGSLSSSQSLPSLNHNFASNVDLRNHCAYKGTCSNLRIHPALKKNTVSSHPSRRYMSGLNATPTIGGINNNIQLSICMGLLHLILGSLGTPIVAKAISIWYNKIDKPKWTPPNRIFAPTWTILYTLMGIAFSRILQQLGASSAKSLWKHPLVLVWTGHILLNIIWAPIFFGLQQLRVGLYINCGLLLSLCGIIIPWYSKTDIVAMYMVIPYAIWLLYATCLNRSISLRNPGPYNTARFYSDLYKLQQQAAKYANL
jgi:translocator protein